MKNVLFVLDHYLPKASANGICVSKIAEEFQKQNKEIHILAYGEQESFTETENVKLFTVKATEKTNKSIWQRIRFYFNWLLPSRFPAGTDRSITQQLVEKAKNIISQYDIATVVCVFLPNEALCAGTLLKTLFPDVQFVAYMLDACSGGFLPRFFPKAYTRFRKMRWEDNLLSAYDKIVLMSSSKAHYMNSCKQKAWFTKATFGDIPMLLPQRDEKKLDNSDIVFVGTLADNVRTPYYFLEVLNHLDEPVSMIFAGKDLCKKPKELNNPLVELKDLGIVPHEEAKKLIEEGGFLLNIGNNNPNLVPSKIFEYMSMGKPIISTYCSDLDTSVEYLRKYPNVLFLDERDKDYAKAVSRLKAFIKTASTAKVDFDQLEKDFYEATPGAFFAKLNEWGFL